MPQSIETTLAERGARYGSFIGHATITQALKSVMRGTILDDLQDEKFVSDLEKACAALKDKWPTLRVDVREGMEMVAHKFGRSLNGDPEYLDNFGDCQGYAKLVVDRQETDQTEIVAKPVVRRGRPVQEKK